MQEALEQDAKLPSCSWVKEPEESAISLSVVLACILISFACGYGFGRCGKLQSPRHTE